MTNDELPTVMIVNGTSLYCLTCRELLPLDRFRKEKGRGYARDCLGCERKRELQKKPSLKPRQANLNGPNKYNHRKKDRLVTVSGGKCHRCDYNEFIPGLAFHHIELKTSRRGINQMSLKNALREIDKCIMLCRCCHTALHAGYWNAEFIKREGVGWAIKPGTMIINK